MYTVGTHAGFDTPSNGMKYGAGDNSTLNTLHNVDHAFGEFWKQFQNSPYRDNTIIIFTADHTHAYEKPYVELMKNDPTYKPVFTDTIPLIIYDPIHELPSRYDANDDTSLALAPTILHLLNYNNAKNAFWELQYLIMETKCIYMRKVINIGISIITAFTLKKKFPVNL